MTTKKKRRRRKKKKEEKEKKKKKYIINFAVDGQTAQYAVLGKVCKFPRLIG